MISDEVIYGGDLIDQETLVARDRDKRQTGGDRAVAREQKSRPLPKSRLSAKFAVLDRMVRR